MNYFRSLLQVLVLFVVANYAHAQNEVSGVVVPPHLIDSEVELKLKDGAKHTYDGNKWKVVPRESSRKVQALLNSLRAELAECKEDLSFCQQELQKALAEITSLRQELAEAKAKPDAVSHLNRISLHAGIGPDGVISERFNGGEDIRVRQSPIVGIQYQRVIYNQWSIGGTLAGGISGDFRSLVGLVGAGYDW